MTKKQLSYLLSLYILNRERLIECNRKALIALNCLSAENVNLRVRIKKLEKLLKERGITDEI